MLSVLIKPASGLCNIACRYCFYRNEVELRALENVNNNECGGKNSIMDIATAETLIRRAFEYAKRGVSFAFQGGEPTLAGVGFFREFSRLVREYNVKKLPVNYAIQTNGIAVDDEFIEYFLKEDFLVGLSVDGDASLHNSFRVDRSDKGTHNRVMAVGDKMLRAGVKVNILSVVTDEAARYAARTYKYFTSKNYTWLQFINCLAPLDESAILMDTQKNKSEAEFALSPERWLKYNKTLFDLWYADFIHGKRVSIRHFDNFLMIYAGYRPESCDMCGECSIQFVTESNGDVYPCDFYSLERWKLGNIKESGFAELTSSERAVEFLTRRINKNEKCKNCKIYALCRGGCPRYSENPAHDYIYCEQIKEFFRYTNDRFLQLSKMF